MTTQATPPQPSDLPTDPSQYDLELVRAELGRIKAILPVLESYRDREFRELPEKLRQDIHAIQTIIQPTTGGLEKVIGLLWQLGNSEDVCELLLRNESVKEYFDRLMTPSNGSEAVVADAGVVPSGKTPVLPLPGASAATLSVSAEQTAKPIPAAAAAPASATGGTLTIGESKPPEAQPKPPKSDSGATLTLPR